jgi:hypothetical protein
MLKSAKIIVSDKKLKIECAVRNLSATGARLQVSTTYGIPANLALVLDGVHRHCRVAWMKETSMGVAFA